MITLRKTHSILILVIVFTIRFNAQASDINVEQKVTLKPGNYSLLQVIEKIMALKGVNVTYNANSLPFEEKVEFKKGDLTLKEILEELKRSLHIEYTIKDDYIILKLKKSHSKFRISGVVTDSVNNDPLPGANVYLKDYYKGVSSGNDGNYLFTLAMGEYTLTYSYIGYKIKEVHLKLVCDTVINVSLKTETNQIQEVKVTRQRNFWGNMDIGRSISSIDSKKIEKLNSNNASDILQASMPGVWSTSTSGAPGDHQKVRIRGVNSIFGCTDPLYIIDGVAVPIVDLHSLGIADLNVYDIECVTVLKDASSTALYGYQGGNGVIIIDTRQKGENHINFTTKFGVQRETKFYNLMRNKEFLATIDSGVSKKILRYSYALNYPVYSDTLQNTNWQDVLFRDGFINEYQLSGSGTIRKTNFYLSGNYYKHEGIIENSVYKKYSISGKVEREFSRKLGINISFRSSLQENKNNLDVYNGNDLIIEGINKSPCTKSTPDSLYTTWYAAPNIIPAQRNYYNNAYIGLNTQELTDSLIKNTIYKLYEQTNSINLNAKYSFSNSLFFNASTSASFRNKCYSSRVRFLGYLKSNENYLLFNQQLNLNYHKYYRDNVFTVVSGYRIYDDNAYWKIDTISYRYLSKYTLVRGSLLFDGEKASITREIQSFTFHVNYNFKKKYFLSLLGNYEILDINGVKKIRKLFPSAALSYDLSKEIGLNQLSWLNQLMISFNCGQSGNYPLNALSKDMYKINYFYYFDDTIVKSKIITQVANHYIKPEIITEYNYGLKLGLLDNRIKLNAESYDKNISNLAIIRDIPAYYGGGKAMINVGKVTNSGFEISLDVEFLRTRNLSWISSFVISRNKQRVEKIGSEKKMKFVNYDILIPQFEVAINEEVGVIKGYKYIGPWTEEDTKLIDKRYIEVTGGKYFKADTSNSRLSDGDIVTIGKTLPDYTWHWDNVFAFKSFTVEMLWYAVIGVDKFNSTKSSTYMSGLNADVAKFVMRGDASLTSQAFYQSSYFVENASFIRMKRLTFTYSYPKKVFNHADLKLALSFENLITFTKYTGYDPEASIYTDNSFSDLGVDRGAYPNPKSVFFSVMIGL